MQIKADAIIEKATRLAEGEVEFVVSTGDLDSHGERVNVAGIDYKKYVKGNNVILWAHDGFNLPIGNTTKMWIEDNKLMARAKFYLKDEFPRKVYQYILDGVVKAASIGGVVEEWSNDGLEIARMTMKEWSIVSVPANDFALVANKAYTKDKQTEMNSLARTYARKLFVKTDGDELHENIKTLKKLTAALEELALSEPQEEMAKKPEKVRVVLRQAQVVDHQVEKIILVVKRKILQ